MSKKQISPAKRRIVRRTTPRCSYGWAPDLPDHRDHVYAAPMEVVAALPPKADLRVGCPAVYDQGAIGSCTANAIAAAMEFDLKKQGLPEFVPSRLFIYYNERSMEGSVPLDRGAQIRDGIKSVVKQGACPETKWTYDDTPADKVTHLWPANAKPRQKPPAAAYKEALKHQALSYQRLDQDLDQLRGCLASGYPFVFGFTVYASFESLAVKQTGVVSLPAAGEKVKGGHAVLAVGYDDSSKRFIVRNSWGDDWGQAGYFTMPYDYLLNNNLSDDFWTIRVVE